MSERTSSLLSKIVFVALGVAALIAAPQEGPPQPPPSRPIPGLTAPDAFPGGCVDCHRKMPGTKLDPRLSVRMEAWQAGVDPVLLAKVKAFSPEGMKLKGRHPKTSASLADIPRACLKCHTRSSQTAPPFARLLHGLHLAGGEERLPVSFPRGMHPLPQIRPEDGRLVHGQRAGEAVA